MRKAEQNDSIYVLRFADLSAINSFPVYVIVLFLVSNGTYFLDVSRRIRPPIKRIVIKFHISRFFLKPSLSE